MPHGTASGLQELLPACHAVLLGKALREHLWVADQSSLFVSQ